MAGLPLTDRIRNARIKQCMHGQDPKTNFSALAAAVKDVGTRNAAAATVQSGYLDDPKAAPSTLGDVLRDPPDSGTPIDETDRYAGDALLPMTPCRPGPTAQCLHLADIALSQVHISAGPPGPITL